MINLDVDLISYTPLEGIQGKLGAIILTKYRDTNQKFIQIVRPISGKIVHVLTITFT